MEYSPFDQAFGNYIEPGNNNFINISEINLFNKILNHTNNKNIIISPYSLVNIFIILYLASETKTKFEIQKFFGFPEKNYFINFNNNINSPGFIKLNFILVPNYLKINNKFNFNNYGNIIRLDLNNPAAESNKINQLVSKSTNNLINNIIQPDFINKSTDLILVNIIYFKSNWVKKFILTKKNFVNKLDIFMMELSDSNNNYFENNQYQIIELDYINNFTMGIILPKNKSQNIINLKPDELLYYISQLKKTKINKIQIPKFKTDTKYTNLEKIFKIYGVQELFKSADLSNLILNNNNQPSQVSKIIHRAIIMVDEIGTTAAAATLLISENAASNNELNFIANHPFQYYIRYKPISTLIFLGNFS